MVKSETDFVPRSPPAVPPVASLPIPSTALSHGLKGLVAGRPNGGAVRAGRLFVDVGACGRGEGERWDARGNN